MPIRSTSRAAPAINTRYERLAAIDVREYYTDWNGRDAAMLCYTSPPLEADATVTGHPVVSLFLSADQRDAAIHVYLEEVEIDGTCRYVTEGIAARAATARKLRARRTIRTAWPHRSFAPRRCGAAGAG